MKCSQLLFGTVSLCVVVLVYLTTSAYCGKFKTEASHFLIMGLRCMEDQLLFNGTRQKEGREDIVSETFLWPEKNSLIVCVISRFEVQDKGKGGHVYLKSGGSKKDHVELYFESQKGKGFEFQVTIYGYLFDRYYGEHFPKVK